MSTRSGCSNRASPRQVLDPLAALSVRTMQLSPFRVSVCGPDFAHFVKICSWCHITETDAAALARVRIANLAKRFIDCGRALYLQERGFVVDFESFVDASITKENQCLVARPSSE